PRRPLSPARRRGAQSAERDHRGDPRCPRVRARGHGLHRMKHWKPRIADAAESALATGADVIVGLVLAPHYSRLSIAGYRAQLERALDGRAELRMIESWHDFAPFVELLADRVRGIAAHVLFTAHSLPARILEAGDPYHDH